MILGLPQERTELISPSVLDFPMTLKKLNLTVGQRPLSVAMISSIGKLRNLEVLKLHANFEDDKWDVENDEFLQLKYFNFRVSSIKEWNVSDESFPFLEQLLVRKCFRLGELPARFGSVANLRRIVVSDCSESLSDSFQQIVDDQMDAGNEGLQYSFSSSASSES